MKYDKNLLTAIIVVEVPGEKSQFLKYRNVKDAPYQLQKLEKFARGISFAHHINLYHKKDRSFYKQIKLYNDNFQSQQQKANDNKRMF